MARFLASLLLLLGLLLLFLGIGSRADTFGGNVSSVNGQVGAVAVPVYQRHVSPPMAVSTSDGTVAWTFPSAFSNQPTCFYSLATTSTSYTFDFPEVKAVSATSVSLLVTSHPKQMTISGLTLPIVLQLTPAGVPDGTTITFSCLAPM